MEPLIALVVGFAGARLAGLLGVDALDSWQPALRKFVGRAASARGQVLELAGRPMADPQPGSGRVAPEHAGWHREQVFRGEPRTSEPV
ncbi:MULTISPECIES: hypothetical protein [unclassified Streptomyces]|uniref:hypothetical protein n=1 Tax=unclassified Streptomyces TaxID=2593676 RepID=UPI000CD4ED9C|nr:MULTISPECIES: hypothetical protein [unclassified Streptomyces]